MPKKVLMTAVKAKPKVKRKVKSLKAKTSGAVKKPKHNHKKPGANHVKSFYRPKSMSRALYDLEEELESELCHIVWIPLALGLACTAIGLNLMLAIAYSR